MCMHFTCMVIAHPPTLSCKIQIIDCSSLAVQMVCLAFHLPFIIGDVIQEDDSKWKCFLLLLKITSICSAYEIKKEHVHVLRLLIAEHHTLFQETYPNANFIPKMHYLVHYPSLILRYRWHVIISKNKLQYLRSTQRFSSVYPSAFSSDYLYVFIRIHIHIYDLLYCVDMVH